MIETLETRRLLSGGTVDISSLTPVANAQSLTAAEVGTILAQALSQSKTTQVAVVVDREGTVLGMLAGNGAISSGFAEEVLTDATVRARTAALFESNGEAFSTRTARFIIQDHFPPGVKNSAGGPLYGVQFSSLVNSDIVLPSVTPGISGDPGGIPLYKSGVAVGAIGVAGDLRDVAARADLLGNTAGYAQLANAQGRVFRGKEEGDRDEAVALAGAKGYLPPARIRASNIFIGGLRLPFVAEGAAHGHLIQTFDQVISTGAATEFQSVGGVITAVTPGTTALKGGTPEMVNATVDGQPGLLRNRANVHMDAAGVPAIPLTPHADPQESDPIVASSDAGGLSAGDVQTIIANAVSQALQTRAGIRKPNGVHAVVHVAVVDIHGNVLGVYRMEDGTNFSYDIAVQKARTAAFFSDDQHAFSTRAIGFMSQPKFPPGITSGLAGPLYHLQNSLNVPGTLSLQSQPAEDAYSGLADGITIFPGGIPLYKNGKLVGAVGVSGDGVDQDDLISYGGTTGFQPPAAIRSDNLSAADATSFLLSRVQQIQDTFSLGYDAVGQASQTLSKGLKDIRLPYVKFPRQPQV